MNCDLLESFKYALEDHEIDIPFPQRSVHVKGLEQLVNNADKSQTLPLSKD